MMVSDSFQPPSSIPPRKSSSTGISNGHSFPMKSVLKPVPEASWLSPKEKLHTTSSTAETPGSDPLPTIGNDPELYANSKTWSPEKEKILLGPYDYMVDQPGKDVRKQLIAAFNVWLQVPEESLVIITKVVGMLHTASLLYVPTLFSRPSLTEQNP